MSTATDNQPVRRSYHSTIKVEDYLYMWGGLQPGLPEVHDSEEKKSMCSVREVCHLATGRWEQKPTTGTPPLGVRAYAAAAIGREIFYYGGYCNHDDCYHNSLHSFNVDTFNWKELSPTTPHHGPMMKRSCDMVAVQLDGEDYLVVIGGWGSSSNTPTQAGAQYSDEYGYKRCNEIHYYKLSSGEWITPTVTGDRPPPISSFTLTSVTNNTAVLFGGTTTNGDSNNVYIIDFNKTSANCTMLSNPGGSVQWPKGRPAHSSVLINNSTGPHLLVVGGAGARDSWLFDINKRIWKQLFNIPDTVIMRYWHSLLVWSVTPTTNWIIAFGGSGVYTDTRVIELRYTSDNEWSTSEIPLDQYQEKLRSRILSDWEEFRREREFFQEQLQREIKEKEQIQQERDEQLQEKAVLTQQLNEATTLLQIQQSTATVSLEEYQQLEKKTKEEKEEFIQRHKEATTQLENAKKVQISLEEHNEQLQKELNDERKKAEKVQVSLEEHNEQLKEELKEERRLVSSLMKKQQTKKQLKELQQVKDHKEVGVQFDYLIPQSDLIDSSVTIAGQKLFHLQGDRSHSLPWEDYGFRLHCPEGAVSKDTDVAVTALVSGNFKVPKGTVLVSAVYAISVSKPLLKSLTIELQHCVDLKNTGQTSCLKFVRAPLKSPYQFSIIDGGVFRIGNRYGSIERDDFCAVGIVRNGGSSNGGGGPTGSGTTTEGSHHEESNGVNGAESTQPATSSEEEDSSNVEADVTEDHQPDHTLALEPNTVSNDLFAHKVGVQVDRMVISESNVTESDIWYTGMMYHEKKMIAQWMTTFSVVRDLEVLKRFLESKHSTAEQDGPVVVFKYIQPDGSLQLCIEEVPLPESGWTVHPDQQPMELRQSVVDKFQNDPMCSSIHLSIYVKPGIAQEPLHCPIKLAGIDPSRTIFINRPLPTPPSSITVVGNTTPEESTFRSDVAYRVMTECTGTIKKRVDLYPLIDKLVEKRMISETEKNQVTDQNCGLTTDQRMDKLLGFVKASIEEDGEDFGLFIEIIKQENTRRADRLAQTLLDTYKRLS